MYSFNMTKDKQNELLVACNFTKQEQDIFNELVAGTKRKDIPLKLKDKYNMSASTVKRKINAIIHKISQYNEGENITHKVYIHKFPNGKKYVGVCQCCRDRWNGGNGYANNTEMYEDIKKYGWENIEHKVILETSDNYIAYELERILIEELDLINNGYNNI